MCTQIRPLKYWDISWSSLWGESCFKTQQRIRHFVLDETPYGSKQSTLKVHPHVTCYVCVCVLIFADLFLKTQTLNVNIHHLLPRRYVWTRLKDRNCVEHCTIILWILWTLMILPVKNLWKWKCLGIKSTRHILWHNKWIYNGKSHEEVFPLNDVSIFFTTSCTWLLIILLMTII